MNKDYYEHFDETLETFFLEERLKVSVVNKPYFSKTYVTISTPLGSITKGYLDENKQEKSVPLGIAHFLEHKIFEQDGLDVSSLFSAQEASINAFTENNRTTYLFSATNHVFENTLRLIDMFFHPKFTAPGVEKEKNIITEELNMYLDDPYYSQYHALLNQMYESHAVKEDILGTKESIQAISVNDLKAMHETYYQPEVSHVIIIGDINARELETYLNAHVHLPKKTNKLPLTASFKEPNKVIEDHLVIEKDIKIPSVLYGIKLLPFDTKDSKLFVKTHLSFTILMDMLFGKASEWYEQFMDDGLINDTYGLDVTVEDTYAYALLGSETTNPKALYQALKGAFLQIEASMIKEEDFLRFKKQMIGSFIQSLDSLESLSHQMNKYAQLDLVFYDVLELAQTITLDNVKSHLDALKNIDQHAVNMIVLYSS